MQCLRSHTSHSSQLTVGLQRASTAAIRTSILIGSGMQICRFHRAGTILSHTQSLSQTISSISSAFCRSAPRSSLSCRRYSKRPPSFDRGVPQERATYATRAALVQEPVIHAVFESKTGTWQYVVADPSISTAAIIDPVLDYDPCTGTLTTETADSLIAIIKDKGYKVDEILETHAHADHITAASYLQNRLAEMQGGLDRPNVGIGKRIVQVQKMFGKRYGISRQEYEGVFDKLFDDDETFHIGALTATAIHLPGHTPDHIGYKIGDNIFVGDTILNPDLGSARADFPGGSAETLFSSGRRILAFPDHVKIWIGHDYPVEGRNAPLPCMSVQQHREQNKHLKDDMTKEDFVAQRQKRDSMLEEPKLIHQSLQMNIRAGRLPKQTVLGHRMLHLPLKLGDVEW